MFDILCIPIGFIAIIFALTTFRIVFEYERGIVFTLGKFSKIANPGLVVIIPILQSMKKVDNRITTVDIPKQEVMTKDNVPASINAVVYCRVIDPKKAVLSIQNYLYAVSQYGQTALRDVIGNKELDYLLMERESIANEIKQIVDKETDEWGIDITAIKIQDIELPGDMKRAMARQAEAEREKRATIIMSEGERIASDNLSKAAEKLGVMPGALHLRTLQTLADISSDQSNTVIVPIPVELLKALEGFAKVNEKKKK
ncbi:SPFH domain-containing protein [Candidatus Micrarchaeota archaeon]|nr:SPFH domain-containing protein [Candidatus Micrarchaeota archaeon]